MARINGTDAAIKVGATSNSAVGQCNSFTLNETIDKFTRKPLGVAYSELDTGHTDWTATVEVDLNHSDTEFARLLTKGAAVTCWFYTDLANTKGRTGAGVVTGYTYNVGAQTTTCSVDIGGNGALSDIS